MKNIFKLSQQQESTSLSGPEVDNLISVVHEMFRRGAPTDFDDLGFNKNDWGCETMQYIMGINAGSAIPTDIAIDAVRRLNIYKNTQLHTFTDYKAMKAGIIRLIQSSTQTEDDDSLNYGDKIVQYTGKGQYGKEEFLIPQFGRGEKILINRGLRAKMQELSESGDSRYKQVSGSYGTDYPVFKAFSAVRSKVDHYDIHPDFMPEIAIVLDSKGYDVSQITSFGENQARPTSGTVQKDSINGLVLDGNKLTVDIGSYIPEIVSLIKNQPDRRYDSNTRVWDVFNPSVEFLKDLSSILEAKGFETEEVSGIVENLNNNQNAAEDSGEESGPLVEVYDVSEKTGGRWLMSVRYFGRRIDEDLNDQFKDVLKYNFIGFTKDINDDDAMRCSDEKFVPRGEVFIRGTMNDMFDFGLILKNRGFDVSMLRSVTSKLLSNGVIEKIKEKRKLDGFEDLESFVSTVKTYEDAFFAEKDTPDGDFYRQQIDGVSFLYSSNSALLGDSVGTGKTLQCVIAADMRIKHDKGKCIVVTVNSVVPQYMKEIEKITGVDPSEISDNPHSNAKYRVLSYTLFSKPGSREDVTNHLREEARSGDINVLILDEVHNVKNGNPRHRNANGDLKHRSNHTTFNIQEVSQYVPFVWGASATIVANKPIDLYNQMVAVNHKLGKIGYGKFKFEFDSGGVKEKLISADKLKEILLDQGVYVQRTKKSIRGDMPEQFVAEQDAVINTHDLDNSVRSRMSGYKNPNLPISAMTAFRTSVAEHKVPQSLAIADSVLSQGKKVAIFTNFNESADLLTHGLRAILEKYQIDGTVAQIRGNQRNRQQIVENFKSPNSTDMAIVINIKAGGTGLDFPNILKDVIVNDFDWSVAQDEQSLGRFYRINSQEDINVTYVIANSTLDRDFYQILDNKRRIAERIKKLSEEEMQMLNDGIRGRNKRLRELRDARHEALMEQEQLGGDKDIINNMGNQVIQDLNNPDILANSNKMMKNWFKRLK